MKVQQINEFGAPDVFHAADIEPPTPGPRQIRVRQMATSVNPVDTKPVSYTHLTLPTICSV